jgi:hypothetical protein
VDALSTVSRRMSMGLAEAVARYAPLAPRDTALLLTEVDWQVLFGVASEVVVEPGEVVLQQGHCFRRLYHVQEGELDVMVRVGGPHGERPPVDRRAGGERRRAPAGGRDVWRHHVPDWRRRVGVACRGRVKSRVSWVERRALTPLFDRNALLAGKFYKYVALVCAQARRGDRAAPGRGGGRVGASRALRGVSWRRPTVCRL